MPPSRLVPVVLSIPVLLACSKRAEDDLNLRERDKDAGPAVVVVDKGQASQFPQVDEKEPNDAKSGGQAVSLPIAVRGRLDPASDWDVFLIKPEKAGTLQVKLSAVEGVDMILEIQAEDGDLLVASDNGGAKVAEAIPNLFVQPSKYRIVVHTAAPKKEGAPSKKAPDAGVVMVPPVVIYLLEISVGPVPAAGEEREMNDEREFAEDLQLGSVGKGHLGWKHDEDLWKIPLGEVQDDEALSVDVDGIPDVTLRVAVLGGDGQVMLERRGKAGEPIALRNLGPQVGEPAYFVSISGDRSSQEPYTVRAQTGSREADDELEPNDAVATANPLVATRTGDSGERYGTTGKADVDYFRISPVSTPRLLSLRAEPPSGADLDMIVLAADGKAALSGMASAGKKGEPEVLTQVPIAGGQAAYVKVIGKSGNGEEKYRLGWALQAGSPE